MTATELTTTLLTLLAGIGIFLVACQMMSTYLESASSKKLKSMFKKASGSRWLGVGIGAVGTAVIQSSGATTVMTIGFVNAGIITLAQAATIIYGANIGTTVTAQIVALGMFGRGGVSSSVVFAAMTGIGTFISLFSKKEQYKTVGGIVTGFGMLFVGLSLMSSSMTGFAASEGIRTFLAQISNPLLLVLIGAVFTAIIQSSSVMTSIALTMVVSGLINLDQGIFLTMGSNIGSCVVAIVAGMTSSTNAKRTALIHLLFNCGGVVIFMIFGLLMRMTFKVGFGDLFNLLFPGVPQTQLAMFHTVFNCITVLFILPVTNLLVSLVCRMIPDKKVVQDPDEPHVFYIDDNLLKTPPIAVEQTKKEILNMANIAIGNFNRSIRIITTGDKSEKPKFRQEEHELNFLNRTLVDYVVRLSELGGLNEHDHRFLSASFRVVRDIERIGDYAENIVEYADMLTESGDRFSDDALRDIAHISDLINSLHERVYTAYHKEDLDALKAAEDIEDQIDAFSKVMEENHIRRLSTGSCATGAGAHYLSLSSNAERIADHLLNVAKSIRSLTVAA